MGDQRGYGADPGNVQAFEGRIRGRACLPELYENWLSDLPVQLLR